MRLFGTGEEKEIQAESESMSFDEPGVGTNLQQLQLKDFRSKGAHNKFKAAVAEARGFLGLVPLELDPAEAEAEAAAEAVLEVAGELEGEGVAGEAGESKVANETNRLIVKVKTE